MKKIGFCIGLLFLSAFIFGETITKVAVIDLEKVKSVYYKDSKAMRELEKKKLEYQQEIKKRNDEILILEDKLEEAQRDENENRALELEDQIFKKKEFLKQFIKVKQDQLNRLSLRSSQQMVIAEEIMNAIQIIAESQGYSMVIKKSDTDLLWWNLEVDITDDVLKVLLR